MSRSHNVLPRKPAICDIGHGSRMGEVAKWVLPRCCSILELLQQSPGGTTDAQKKPFARFSCDDVMFCFSLTFYLALKDSYIFSRLYKRSASVAHVNKRTRQLGCTVLTDSWLVCNNLYKADAEGGMQWDMHVVFWKLENSYTTVKTYLILMFSWAALC